MVKRPSFLLSDKVENQCRLDQNNRRNTDYEIPVFGLVAEGKHPKIHSDTPTQRRQQKQHLFGHTAFLALSRKFIRAAHTKCHNAHHQNISKQNFLRHIFSPLALLALSCR